MTFDQADALTARIVAFMIECGGCYTEDKRRDLQIIVLTALATGQFVVKINRSGIQYFACWWYVTDDVLDAVLDFDNRMMPADVRTGDNAYVAEVASKTGDAREMILSIKQKAKRPGTKASYWHKPHRSGKLYRR